MTGDSMLLLKKIPFMLLMHRIKKIIKPLIIHLPATICRIWCREIILGFNKFFMDIHQSRDFFCQLQKKLNRSIGKVDLHSLVTHSWLQILLLPEVSLREADSKKEVAWMVDYLAIVILGTPMRGISVTVI